MRKDSSIEGKTTASWYIDVIPNLQNVIIQAFWHLKPFANPFIKIDNKSHQHHNDNCVFCALKVRELLVY